jgi:hypothetical protein
VAAGLLNIHHHSKLDEQGNCDTIYKESELLELLKSWGIAKPDWEGHEKRLMDIENALIERINKQP